MTRKICVVTGSRAEFGLLHGVMQRIKDDPELRLQVITTGMHQSPEFGMTANVVEEEGFVIDKKVEMLLSSDTPVGISKSIGLGIIGMADALDQLQPDIVLVLGDRFEILAAAIASAVNRNPLAHIHGGEATQGAIDEAFRHTITKMSHIHFTSTDIYRKRVIQLGESPDRVFNVGALGVENITKMNLLSKQHLEKQIQFSLDDQTVLVTFHPVTLEQRTADQQFNALLNALDSFPELRIIFTKANADTEGRIINEMIDDYINSRLDRCIAFTSMGQLKYLSTMQFADAVIGNSSSGVIEAPSFCIPTINIGDRQKGRVKADSVIDCIPDKDSIIMAIDKGLSEEFKIVLNQTTNPYYKKDTTKNIVSALKKLDLSDVVKKKFYDIHF